MVVPVSFDVRQAIHYTAMAVVGGYKPEEGATHGHVYRYESSCVKTIPLVVDAVAAVAAAAAVYVEFDAPSGFLYYKNLAVAFCLYPSQFPPSQVPE